MADIIQTDRGVYDISTLYGCFSYLCRECGLSGQACAMVNKLYVMANIAELAAENTRPAPDVERLVELIIDEIVASPDVQEVHYQGLLERSIKQHILAALTEQGKEG